MKGFMKIYVLKPDDMLTDTQSKSSKIALTSCMLEIGKLQEAQLEVEWKSINKEYFAKVDIYYGRF